MSERCEDTGLLVAQCAGACCRPDLKTPPAERVRTGATFEAQYRSKCDLCGGDILPGQQAGYDSDDNLVCQRHLEPLNRRTT